MKRSHELAAERLGDDIYDAITKAAAEHAHGASDGKERLDMVMAARSPIKYAIQAALRRNWRVIERARGSRLAGDS